MDAIIELFPSVGPLGMVGSVVGGSGASGGSATSSGSCVVLVVRA